MVSKIFRVDFEDGEVVRLVNADESRGIGRSVLERNRDPRRALHYMCVSENRAVGADDEPGTESRRRSLAGSSAEKLLEDVGRNLLDDLRLDRHDRRSDAGDGLGNGGASRCDDPSGGRLHLLR